MMMKFGQKKIIEADKKIETDKKIMEELEQTKGWFAKLLSWLKI